MSERPPKFSIPIKRIEKLIQMAKDNNLACLEVGHIKIIPEPQVAQIQPGNSLQKESKYEQEVKMAQRNGKPLTPRQQEDLLLFGPSGVTFDD